MSGHVTVALALRDLQQYDGQLATLVSVNSASYPADSIRQRQTARAAAWLARLRGRDASADGDDAVGTAVIAMRAEQDSVARAYLDTRLAQLRTVPTEASAVLAAGVALFANPEHDSIRAVRNYSVAESYARRLMALPATGYTTRSDSLTVRQRQRLALITLLRGREAR